MTQEIAFRPFRSIQCRIPRQSRVRRTFLLALLQAMILTNQSAEIELSLVGINAKSAAGETLSASKVDSVNTFDAPNTVVPKPISAKAQDGKLTLKLEPKSVTVVAIEQ